MMRVQPFYYYIHPRLQDDDLYNKFNTDEANNDLSDQLLRRTQFEALGAFIFVQTEMNELSLP